ncbi:GNAT family N-acetyltransferase [Paeniglutamicibacter sp. NPDC091659]|uniref:GNAT family N-acetyltransferase n=1 Tax=Paeniglutamicibacter sp. NPDC091659 TaxID=3364389 RepID=UPI003806DE03
MNSLVLPHRAARLVLRPHAEADASWLLQVYSRPEVARYLLDDPWTAEIARKKTSERIAKTDLDGDAGALALVIEHDQTPVGDVILWFTDRERRSAEIGWVLDPDHGGKGLATEAVRAVLDLAFDHYRVHRVAAQMDGRNMASAKLARRAGMRHEAHLRQDWWSKNEWTDTVIFGVLAGDRT